jgi:(1->4)-alpha-D-glucan 1-alpha-D-glucosylmutase
MQKALREAKVNTAWVEPNERHERAVGEAIDRFYDAPPGGFEEFAARVAEEGRRVALAQTLLKLTSPGVPDIYQGDELESLNLVDPDNRRPVDWNARRLALADSPPKLRLIRDTLAVRARRPHAFAGEYEPLDMGPDACAFYRGDREVLIAVPLRRSGHEALLPGVGRWRGPVTGREFDLRGGERLGDLLDAFPVLLLERATGL